MTEEEASVTARLVDSWYRTMISSAFQRRRIGRDGSTTLDLFAVHRYEYPGAARIWQEMTKSESRYLSQLAPEEASIQNANDEIRQTLSQLEKTNHQ